MNHSALQNLEWNSLIEQTAPYARSELGLIELQKLLEVKHWAESVEECNRLQQECANLFELIDKDQLWGPLSGLVNPYPYLESLLKGRVLEPSALAILRQWTYSLESWVLFPKEELINAPQLQFAMEALFNPKETLKHIDRVILPNGEINEHASTKLAALYQEVRSIKQEISKQMDRLMKSYAEKNVLQETYSDVHDGRYVLPVKISSQSEVAGNLYSTSASRQTVFIEPAEIAAINNRLKQKQNDLEQELYHVLEICCKAIRPDQANLRNAFEVMGYWDSVAAKAQVSKLYQGKPIRVGAERIFKIKQTANPLLWFTHDPRQIIRNDIEWKTPSRTLLLTGPNTGGKTVFMKTLGLACLCAKTGFPFPSHETEWPEVPFFNQLFADVGDPQSIEEHLSSFSGHIERFKEILTSVTDQSLILLDEINTATDPGEGAALGRAFLETLMNRNAMIVGTTHDPGLKVLATEDPRILCASMAFNEETRTPTYQILLGTPGRSRALETAERLGIPSEVIHLAKSYLTQDHHHLESVLERLERKTSEIQSSLNLANAKLESAHELEKEWKQKIQIGLTQTLEKTQIQFRKLFESAQEEIRKQSKQLEESRTRKNIDQSREGLAALQESTQYSLQELLKTEAPDLVKGSSEVVAPPQFSKGERVSVPKWKNTGIILDFLPSRKVKVQCGALPLTLFMEEIFKLSDSEQKVFKEQERSRKPVYIKPKETDSIDLRGTRYEEAMSQLSSYLDHSYRQGTQELIIIHGFGTGAIREGTRRLLGSLPYIEYYGDAGPGQGGSGATKVVFILK